MKNLFLFLSLFLTSASSFAGGASTGGGGAFVCRDRTTGDVIDSELLDLWEGINLRGLTIPYTNEDVDLQIDRALKKVEPFNKYLFASIKQELANIRSNAVFLPPEISLPAPIDAIHQYSKRNCPLEGMMFYDGDLDHLSIDNQNFSKLLNNTNIAAAWVHEVLYKFGRSLGHTDSVKSRKLTACLFSSSKCFEVEPLPANPARILEPQNIQERYHCSSSQLETDLIKYDGLVPGGYEPYYKPIKWRGWIKMDRRIGSFVPYVAKDITGFGFTGSDFSSSPYPGKPMPLLRTDGTPIIDDLSEDPTFKGKPILAGRESEYDVTFTSGIRKERTTQYRIPDDSKFAIDEVQVCIKTL